MLDGRLVDFAGHLAAPAPLARPSSRCRRRSTTPASRRSTASSSPGTRVDRGHGLPPGHPRRRRPRLRLAGRARARASSLFTQARPLVDTASARDGIRVIAVPDIRWARRDIKTVQLLAPSMCKMLAKQGRQGRRLAGRGRLRHRGHLEQRLDRHRATASLVTRDLSSAILHGITRAAVLRARRRGADPRRGAALHHRRGAAARRKPSSPPPRPS